MAKQGGLGRGLSSLIPTNNEAVSAEAPREPVAVPQKDPIRPEPKKERRGSEGKESHVPCSALEPNPFQPRRVISEASIEELAASIRVHGVLQPLLVRPKGDGTYQIVAGERRWRAAMRAGVQQVPVRVIEMDDRAMREAALVENLQREDLSPLDVAESINELIQQFSSTHEAIAERLGWSRSAVTNKLRLLQLPASVKSLLSSGAITEGHARALLRLQDQDKIEEIARLVVHRGLSVRQTEEMVRRMEADAQGGERGERTPRAINHYPYEFADQFGVEIGMSGKADSLTLHLRNLNKSQAHKILALIDQHRGLIFPGK
ncbi:ParB-like partition protein [Thermanaerovibrio velox DSM 12556]|uniref:ParB-like partition protein n=1 Tax=Thermanaerovibrio velox DSM 12556 TaxID=926567 RepID=H0UR58_9BACT|nr:ParB/RepB/Spo0J family partition protein [Thermanaerovibrio velox]EHM10895.1 ParB-like partition protein [Thermanaerovibrio velox DSM 12556]